MAKIVIDPKTLIKNQPGGEHISRIAHDVNEPAKNYIWCKPDGNYYVWNGTKWVLFDGELVDLNKPNPIHSECITKYELDSRIKILKSELLRQFKKMIELVSCSGEGGSDNYDHSIFLTYEVVLDPESVQL